jgi:hypothetical protein
VIGAGIQEVNGAYFEDGKYDGVAQYSKKGEWEGKSGKFEVFRCVSESTKRRRWYICWSAEKKHLQFYYCSELDESGMETIPDNTWELWRNEVKPTPRVLFVPGKDGNRH